MSALPKQEWELFNISEDHTEMHNLADQCPNKVTEMNEAWARINLKRFIRNNNKYY